MTFKNKEKKIDFIPNTFHPERLCTAGWTAWRPLRNSCQRTENLWIPRPCDFWSQNTGLYLFIIFTITLQKEQCRRSEHVTLFWSSDLRAYLWTRYYVSAAQAPVKHTMAPLKLHWRLLQISVLKNPAGFCLICHSQFRLWNPSSWLD